MKDLNFFLGVLSGDVTIKPPEEIILSELESGMKNEIDLKNAVGIDGSLDENGKLLGFDPFFEALGSLYSRKIVKTNHEKQWWLIER